MACAVARLSEKRFREEGSQVIVVSESICIVVNKRTIIKGFRCASGIPVLPFDVVAPKFYSALKMEG